MVLRFPAPEPGTSEPPNLPCSNWGRLENLPVPVYSRKNLPVPNYPGTPLHCLETEIEPFNFLDGFFKRT